MTLTIELPDTLMQQFHARKIPEKEIQAVAQAALEIWLAQPEVKNESRFADSAIPFIRRVITQNRQLFDTLAKR
jgi:hypothetical protein